MAKAYRKPVRKVPFDGDGWSQGTAVVEKEAVMRGNGEYAERQLADLLAALEAVRNGDLTVKLKKRREDIFGELADSYNSTVDILNRFSAEVTRVAREVGVY